MDFYKYDTLDVKKRCEGKLAIHFRARKENNGWFFFNGQKIARITIPKGRKPIYPKTYKSFANQLKVSVEFFDGIMSCPNKLEHYLKELGLSNP